MAVSFRFQRVHLANYYTYVEFYLHISVDGFKRARNKNENRMMETYAYADNVSTYEGMDGPEQRYKVLYYIVRLS